MKIKVYPKSKCESIAFEWHEKVDFSQVFNEFCDLLFGLPDDVFGEVFEVLGSEEYLISETKERFIVYETGLWSIPDFFVEEVIKDE